MKRSLGKVPSSGRPRLTRFRAGTSRFTLVDPSGNNLIFIQRDEPMELEYGGSAGLTGIAKALDDARILREFKNDDLAAFRALNSAIRRPKPTDTDVDRAAALAVMIELAPSAGQAGRIEELQDRLLAIPLTGEQREQVEARLVDPDVFRRRAVGGAS